MIVVLLALILLALVFPGLLRFLLLAAFVLGVLVFVGAFFTAGDMYREGQLRDPGSPMSRELQRQRTEGSR
jgi:hypothetical protein